MKNEILGCDFVVNLGEERKNTKIKVLQLTDTQVIDAAQRRTPERLRPDEISAWDKANFDAQCGDHIRSLITQTHPDLIIFTGDVIYGSFDDAGTSFDWFCNLMDSFEIPWAPVFGNHDNEAEIGVDWQCNRFAASKYCLFKRGEVSGNGNYTVGIATGDTLVRVIHMIDSNGCFAATDPSVMKAEVIYPDQLELVRENTRLIRESQKREVPAFFACHIPLLGFKLAETEKGYYNEQREKYVLGVNVQAQGEDFGFRFSNYRTIKTDVDIIDFLRSVSVDGVFVGHVHNNSTAIDYKGIKWVFGLKTGQYDHHIPGQLGATLINLYGDEFTVTHIPSLVHYSPMPGRDPMFKNFFANED